VAAKRRWRQWELAGPPPCLECASHRRRCGKRRVSKRRLWYEARITASGSPVWRPATTSTQRVHVGWAGRRPGPRHSVTRTKGADDIEHVRLGRPVRHRIAANARADPWVGHDRSVVAYTVAFTATPTYGTPAFALDRPSRAPYWKDDDFRFLRDRAARFESGGRLRSADRSTLQVDGRRAFAGGLVGGRLPHLALRGLVESKSILRTGGGRGQTAEELFRRRSFGTAPGPTGLRPSHRSNTTRTNETAGLGNQPAGGVQATSGFLSRSRCAAIQEF